MYKRNILSHWKSFLFLLEDEFEKIKGCDQNPYVEEGQTTQWPKEKGKQGRPRSIKHYTKSWRSSSGKPTKNLGWSQMVQQSGQFLLHWCNVYGFSENCIERTSIRLYKCPRIIYWRNQCNYMVTITNYFISVLNSTFWLV